MYARAGASLPLLLAVVALTYATAPLSTASAQTATFVVDDFGDGADAAPGDGIAQTASGTTTLVAAIQEANAQNTAGTSGPFVVEIPALSTISAPATPTTYWYGPGAFPEIAADIEINGNGSTLLGSTSTMRAFYVSGGAVDHPLAGSLTLRNLIIDGFSAKGGDTPGGTSTAGTGGGGLGAGGAIFNQGTLTIESCAFFANTATGGSAGQAGGISDGGSGGGGMGGDGGGAGSSGGGGGGGGFGGNGGDADEGGGGGGGYSGDGGDSGYGGGGGGAIGAGGDGSLSTNGDDAEVGGLGGGGGADSSFTGGLGDGTGGDGGDGSVGNEAGQNANGIGGGGGGGYYCCGMAPGGDGGLFGGGGGGGYYEGGHGGNGGLGGGGGGGGEDNGNGGNGGLGGGGGGGGYDDGGGRGGNGGWGGGGGGYADDLTFNIAGGDGGFGGGGGGGKTPGQGGWAAGDGGGNTTGNDEFAGGGGAGLGGAIFNHGGTVTITNTTFGMNAAEGGDGGSGDEAGGDGGSGFGGAIFNLDGDVTLLNVTMANNDVQAGAGGSSIFGPAGTAGSADGSGIYNRQDQGTATVTISNSILADATNGVDFLNDGGTVTPDTNLVESNTGVTGGFALTTDPGLGAVRNQVGTRFYSPANPGAAIDAANPATAATTDQRGLDRALGAPSPDLGAIEFYQNMGPSVFAPGPGALDGNNRVYLQQSDASAIQFSDPDAGPAPVQVNIVLTDATITLSTLDGVFLQSGTGTADTEVEILGPIDAINAALEGAYVTYTATANFTMQIDIDDLGAIGDGGAQQASATVGGSFLANQPPVIEADQTAVSVTTTQVIVFDQDNLLQLADPDNADWYDVQLDVIIYGGVVSFGSIQNVDITNVGSNYLIRGSQDAINNMLNGSVYKSTTPGQGGVIMSYNDENPGPDGSQVTTEEIEITSVPVNTATSSSSDCRYTQAGNSLASLAAALLLLITLGLARRRAA